MTILERLDAATRDKRLPHELRERIAIKLEQGAGLDVLEALVAELRPYRASQVASLAGCTSANSSKESDG